jgi:uncharacterized protein YndB with AHSA1/START domain
MDKIAEAPAVRMSRLVHAPPRIVFEAWMSAEHVSRWFSPEALTVPSATVEARVGGAFDICMRSPDGEEHWTRGVFVEVTPHTRLVIDMAPSVGSGPPLFRARTEIDFIAEPGGTRLNVVQSYEFVDAALAGPMVAGAHEGWRGTLDKLEREVMRMQTSSAVGERRVAHGTFHLERVYPAPAAKVWMALTDPEAKAVWFSGVAGAWTLIERKMDVRPGGGERLKGRWESGLVTTFEAVYHDVIPGARLVYSYEMWMDDRKISVSLATMEIEALGAQTRLRVTEQGAFLDGYEDGGSREHGTGALLDALGAALAA